jgi:hypothetical protein
MQRRRLRRVVAQGRPDRRIDVIRRLPGADGAAVEPMWSGTSVDSGVTMQLACIFAFDIDATGSISRLRGYYAM